LLTAERIKYKPLPLFKPVAARKSVSMLFFAVYENHYRICLDPKIFYILNNLNPFSAVFMSASAAIKRSGSQQFCDFCHVELTGFFKKSGFCHYISKNCLSF